MVTSDLQTVPDEAQRALTERQEPPTVSGELIVADMIREVATMNGRDGQTLQRWSVKVPLYPKHQYLVKGASSKLGGGGYDDEDSGGGSWVSDYSASPRAEGYDWMNRVMGVQIHTPPTVHNRKGQEVPNPIHDGDYLYHRSIGIGYNDLGQLTAEVADIEIDMLQALELERMKKALQILKRKGGEDLVKLLRDEESGAPRFGKNGEMLFQLPTKDEFTCAQRLGQLRNFGGRSAETIARRRILTIKSGIRTLWSVTQGDKPQLYTVFVNVIGWKDQMRPDERLAQAKQQSREVFGAPLRERGDPSLAVDAPELEDAQADSKVADTEAAWRVQGGGRVGEDPGQIDVDEESPEESAGVESPVVQMVGEKIAKAERTVKSQVCAELAPKDNESDASEGCMLLLDDDGRHLGPHKSASRIWPQTAPSAE